MRLARLSFLILTMIVSLFDSWTHGDEVPPCSVPRKPQPERSQISGKLAQIHEGDSEEDVRRVMGAPDDIRRATELNLFPTAEIWGYGTDGHGSLATLGEVCFRQRRVLWVAGACGKPPSPSAIGEDELRKGMRFMHPGPEYATYNDPLHLIRVTNYLQPLGKEKALAIIGEYARIHELGDDETWLFLVLRALFDVPQPPGYMPRVRIGAVTPAPPEDAARIPRFPLVIIDSIPFSLLRCVVLAGEPQPVSEHVEYFRSHGTMRVGKLRPPDDPYPSFHKLLRSTEWAEMASAEGSPLEVSAIARRSLLQILALTRTVYDPPEARQPDAYPSISDFDRHHKRFLETGARWDDQLQIYVRRDGSHGEVGQLRRIEAKESKVDK